MTKTRDSASPIDAADEELFDTLIAISVVAKRLAANPPTSMVSSWWKAEVIVNTQTKLQLLLQYQKQASIHMRRSYSESQP